MRHLKHIRDLIQRVAGLPITIFWVNNRSWGKLRKLSSQISLSQTMSTPSRLKAVVNFHYDYILTVKCRLKEFCTTLNLSRCLQTVPHLKWSVSFVLFLFYKVFYLPSQAGMFRCLRISDIHIIIKCVLIKLRPIISPPVPLLFLLSLFPPNFRCFIINHTKKNSVLPVCAWM